LLDGQAAINFNASEPGLFFRLTNGQLCKVGPAAVTDNGMEPNAAPAGETGNAVGEEWLDAHPALHAPILHVFNGTEFVTANGFTVDKSTGNLTLLRQLEVTKLITASAQVNGPLVVGGNITPNGQNCAFYLGLPEERWDYLYSCNLDVKFDALVDQDLTVTRNATVTNNLTVSGFVTSNLTPDVDGVRSLGVNGQRWDAFVSELNATTVTSNLVPDVDDTRTFGQLEKRWAQVHTTLLSAYGNTIIGTECADTLTVNATSTFKCPVTFEVPIDIDTIGSGCSDTLTVNATTTFNCPVDIGTIGSDCSDTLTVNAATTFNCPVDISAIGSDCSDTLAVTATTTFNCPVAFKEEVSFDQSLVNPNFIGDIVLGNGCETSTIDLHGAVTLSCDMVPNHHNSHDIGTPTDRLKALYATDVYTGDLHLKNEHGDWTMIEAEEYLTIRNNKTGKTFRLLMEEV